MPTPTPPTSTVTVREGQTVIIENDGMGGEAVITKEDAEAALRKSTLRGHC